MNKWECDWFIGCITAAVIILGVVLAILAGVTNSNEKYYASMDKCTTAGGSFIPQSQGNALCLMGVKQQ